jgi:DNA helicase II / ATP-dependent DNA helicase PcrA
MDKRVMFAVAGSGKTTFIVNKLNRHDPILIITYTVSNTINLRNAIIRKFGSIPPNIYFDTYFSFLYSFCIRPLLTLNDSVNGLYFESNTNRFASGDARYLTQSRLLYANRAARFIEHRQLQRELLQRIEKYFMAIYIDEVQDFGGHDFNFLKLICKADAEVLFVGDFYQHTFDTSHDANVNRGLHDEINSYKDQFDRMGLGVDCSTLQKSWRCSPQTCDFISTNLGIPIQSNREDRTEIREVTDEQEARQILRDPGLVKLFYMKHYEYKCSSRNWGECKGEDLFHDVCVVMNNTTDTAFRKTNLLQLATQTKNKFYVACSRARGDLYLVSEKLMKKCSHN